MSMRYIILQAATIRSGEIIGSKVIMVNDVSRALFEAPAMRQVCAEVPVEDVTPLDRQIDHVGHLQMSLYGTRDAAMSWQEEVAR